MLKLIVIILIIWTSLINITFSLNSSLALDESLSVHGVLGQKVSLPCFINTNDCGEVYLIAWTKGEKREESDNWSRVYVYSEQLNKPLKDLANRARFELDPKRGAFLIIDTLKYSDEANYKCDVTYIHPGKCPSITFINLNISVAPSKAIIRKQGHVMRSGAIVGPYKEGDELQLECSVTGGKPLPTLYWQQSVDDNIQNIYADNHYRDNVTSIELAFKLKRNDLNSNFVCHVKHTSVALNERDEYVQLDLHVGALSLEIIGATEDVHENDVVKIRCIAHGSRPHVHFEWLNGTRSLSNTKAKEEIFLDKVNGHGTKRTESTIEIVATRYDHLANIQCLALNSAMINPLKKSIQIHVLFSPIVVMEPQNGLILNEHVQSIDIYCTYKANPPELILNSTRWFKNGKELDFSSHNYFSHFSGYPILSILNVTREHSGSYSCEISNEIGKSQLNQPLTLNVIFPPTVILRIFPDASRGILIKEGDNIQLICDIIDGIPFNITKVKWIKTSEDGNDVIINETSQNEIVWMSVDRTLSANYSCMALNEAGWSEQSNHLELDVKHLPSQPFIRQINGDYPLKGDNLLLECLLEDLGKPKAEEFIWEQDGVPFQDAHNSILNVFNITLANRGNYSCAGVSAAGTGPKGYFFVKPITPPRFIEALPNFNGALFNSSQHSVWCRVECDPICSIKWLENGSLIDPNNNSRYFIKETLHPEEDEINAFISVVSTLNWNMSTALDRYTDNAEISCSSTSNQAGPEIESKMKFFIEYPPEKLLVNPQVLEIVEGNIPNSIHCQSTAFPVPSYRWERYGVPIALKSVLEFQNPASVNSSGNYSCISFNRHGSSKIDAVINVLHKPMCEISESQIKVDKENVYSVLICEALANPSTNLKFVWSLGNESFTSLSNDDIVTDEEARSKIVISSDHLFGDWTCSVTNSIGSSECVFYKPFPILDARWSLPVLDDKSIILIAALIALLIIMFIIILIILICLMKRKRAKQQAQQMVAENKKSNENESSQSSFSTNLPSNQVINCIKDSNLSIKRNDKVMDATKNSQIQSNSAKSRQAAGQQAVSGLTKEMYENMAYHNKSMLTAFKPNVISQYPNYQNVTQLNGQLRRVHSSRCYEKELNALNYGPLERNIVYADLQLTDNSDLMKSESKLINSHCVANHHPVESKICDYAVLRFDKTPSPPSIC